jgi:putative ABC transport system substrate-binding protein
VIHRRRFLLTSLAGALVASTPGETQTAGTPRRIGVLYTSARAADTRSDESLIGGLRALGWIEGRNLVVERRWAEGRTDRLQELAHEFAQARVEVIVTAGTTAIRAVAGAASGIPIVMAGGGDPVGTGLVASLARPGGNITGVSLIGREILGKALELLKETVSRVNRVGVLMNAANPANDFFFAGLLEVAGALRITLERLDVRDASDIGPAVSRASGGGLLALTDPLFATNRNQLADVARRHRIPTMVIGRWYVEAGALVSYAFPLGETWRLAASYVDKILNGAKPADLPVEQPTKFELVINLKTAKALGLTIPPSLLARADQVIDP